MFCVIVPILGAILFPVFAHSQHAAKSTTALSNMKSVAVSVLIYQADYDDMFPITMGEDDGLYSSLAPYLADTESYHSFGVPTSSNPSLAGKSALDIPDPYGTLMLFKAPPELDPDAVCAATDGSVLKVSRSDLDLEISSNSWRMPSR